MRRWIHVLLLLMVFVPVAAQNSKKVKDLQRQRDKLQKELKASQQQLETTKRNITQHRKQQQRLGVQINQHLDSIRRAEDRMLLLDSQMVDMHRELAGVADQLQERKAAYAAALRASRALQNVQRHGRQTLLSARLFNRACRRNRDSHILAASLRKLGEELQEKEVGMLALENNLLQARGEMNTLMVNVMEQRRALGVRQQDELTQINRLGTQQKGLESKLSKQRNQLAQLNKKIDAVVAAEVEAARKRAEEARRKAAAKAGGKKGTTTTKPATATAPADKWLTPEEKALNGSFVQNKGRLPIPLTGTYKVGERFGTYNVPGMQNVQLDNKGVNYIGRPGAQARAVFDGEVTAVFQFYNTKGVLVRHGSYITVYCNLSSVRVQRGQKVKARAILGNVATNEDGQCVLHFQLRKETQKLNPEAWLGR